MKPTDELFNLIKSLTPHEKRYFKLFASLNAQNKNPEYIKLFDAIDSMAVYNEALLKAKHANEKFTKQFAYHKNYLTHAIIKSMGLFHAENKIVLQLLDMLKEIEFLFSKGQITFCKKWIKKGITECEAYSQYELLKEFLTWQQKVAQAETDFSMVSNIADKKIKLNESFNHEYQYKKAYYELLKIAYRSGLIVNKDDEEKINIVCKKFMLHKPLQATTLIGEYYYYSSKSIEGLLMNHDQNRIKFAAKAVDILESNEKFITTNMKLYMTAINNLSIAYGKAQLHKEKIATIEKLKKFIETHSNHIDKTTKATATLNVLQGTITTYASLENFNKAIALENDIVEALQKYSKDAPLTNSLDLMFNLASIFFDAKNYNKSLDWLNRIIALYQPGYRDDLFIACRLLSLMIHYELKNTYYLENSITSTSKFLTTKKRLTYSEEALLLFLKKTIKAKNETNTVAALKELQQKIKKMPKSKHDNIISYIDIEQWAYNKLEEMQNNKAQ